MRSRSAYLTLTKPGIIFGNLVTGAGGFVLASRGHFDWIAFFIMMCGLTFVVGSACVFNNIIDREHDQKMHRTRNRPLVKGVLDTRQAARFGSLLLIAGTCVLLFGLNAMTALMALIGFIAYVFVYTFSKYKTKYGTLIGSISGAMPPLVGYAAAGHGFNLGAAILFLMVVFWQMPHFYAIAIYRSHEYAAAGIPVMPLIAGIFRTKVEMALYSVAFLLVSISLFLTGHAGWIFLCSVAGVGGVWLLLSIKGFFQNRDGSWARKMFIFSLVVIMTTCIALIF